MTKRYDHVDDALEDKLRVGETILWIYGCLLTLAGVGLVIAKCLVAEFGAAFVGFVATITGAGLIALCWLVFRLIRKTASNAFRLERLKQRVDELELELDAGADGIQGFQTKSVEASAHQENESAETLREAFALQLRNHEYETALETGRRITELFPQSRMSSDFQAIRKRVETLADSHRNENNHANADHNRQNAQS